MQRLAKHLHDLGPRAIFEFLAALEDRDAVLAQLESYRRLDPTILLAVGGNRFPHAPVRVVA